jgi:flagellar biosynthesis repressor protein FlbT
MPLTIRLKPSERLIVNGAVLRNGSPRAIEIELLNHVTTLHERDLMLPEDADTLVKRLYFAVQMMHLEPDNEAAHRRAAIAFAAQAFAAEAQLPDGGMGAVIEEVIGLLGERTLPQALRRLQKEIGKPGDLRAAAAAPEPEQAVAE